MAPCRLCNDLQKKDETDPHLGFDFTPDGILYSVMTMDCNTCTVILEGIQQAQDREWSWQKDLRRIYARCCGKRNEYDRTLLLEIYFVDDRPKLELEFFSLQIYPWKVIHPRSIVSDHPLSVQALTWVRTHMGQCINTHTACKRADNAQAPTRLLHLKESGHDGVSVRLVDLSDKDVLYAALSHCWGAEQACTTTTSTLDDRRRNISWSIIPKTFRDAIIYTLRLGLQYLWIDSLCIVQDDSIDWETESSKMASVYQHALITLAATSSAGDSQGCFDRVSRWSKELILPDHITGCRIGIRRPLKHWNNTTSDMLKNHFPLLTRSWALQERLLPPRILHFCESELVWECREMTACECGSLQEKVSPCGLHFQTIHNVETDHKEQQHREDEMLALQLLQEEADRMLAFQLQQEESGDNLEWGLQQLQLEEPRSIQYPENSSSGLSTDFSHASAYFDNTSTASLDPSTSSRRVDPPPYSSGNSESLNKVRSTLARYFHQLIEQYSSLRLTKPADILPALSGVCMRMQPLRGSYKAGLWSDSLCFDLLWRVDVLGLGNPNGGRPLQYRGPSWSWVAVDAPVKYWPDIEDFRDPVYTPNTDLVRFSHTPLGRNQPSIKVTVEGTGVNSFGEVTGGVLHAQASCTFATLQYVYTTSWGSQAHSIDTARYSLNVAGERVPFFADYPLAIDGQNKIEEGTALKLLLIHPLVALVLRPMNKEHRPVYVDGLRTMERIGIARVREGLLRYYGHDWMRNAELRQVVIL